MLKYTHDLSLTRRYALLPLPPVGTFNPENFVMKLVKIFMPPRTKLPIVTAGALNMASVFTAGNSGAGGTKRPRLKLPPSSTNAGVNDPLDPTDTSRKTRKKQLSWQKNGADEISNDFADLPKKVKKIDGRSKGNNRGPRKQKMIGETNQGRARRRRAYLLDFRFIYLTPNTMFS